MKYLETDYGIPRIPFSDPKKHLLQLQSDAIEYLPGAPCGRFLCPASSALQHRFVMSGFDVAGAAHGSIKSLIRLYSDLMLVLSNTTTEWPTTRVCRSERRFDRDWRVMG